MIEVSSILRQRELQTQVELLKKIRKNREENGICFYEPHAKQHKFHVCGLTNRYCRTGNRFGKSEMGIAEDISWALGGRLFYRNSFDILNGDGTIFEKHVGSSNHPYVTLGIPQRPVKGLILVVDWDMAKKIFTNREGSYDVYGKFWKLCPSEAVEKITNGGRGDRIEKIEIKRLTEFGGGSSTISFDTVESYKHNRVGAESADWDFIHVDEPVPQTMFEAHSRGLMDRAGSSWFTCTPLNEMWINDKFLPKGQNIVADADKGLIFSKRSNKQPDHFIVTGSTYDNPYRNQQGVEDFEATLSIDQKACRILGIPAAFSGLIYREFEYDLHVLQKLPTGWKDFASPPLDYTIRVAWDVHDSKPQAILMAATAPTGEVFIYDEMFYDRVIGTNALDLKSRLTNRFVVDYIIDPRAVIESPVTDESILDELFKYDLFFEKASKDLTLGISKVREKLKERKAGSPAAPTIYFNPNLVETLFEFSHYIYKDGKVKDADDHMMENLYRLILNGLDYIAPSEESEFISKPLVIGLNEYSHS